ncbi:MAG: hypothetical protein HKN25_06605 [Pyrinomonadaceae bacterium]|nr:hypothetical protein [Pyrinomonadaceae bacterium]
MRSHKLPTHALQNLFERHNEWLMIHRSGETFSLQNHELELEIKPTKTLLSFLENKGYQTWRVADLQIEDEAVSLDLTRNFTTEKTTIRLIPRTKAEELREAVEIVRLERANEIAAVLVSEAQGLKAQRVELNKENGRFAQIIAKNRKGDHVAVLSDVSGSLTPEILLSSAILWLTKLQRRKKDPAKEIWIIAEKKKSKKLRKLHACLSKTWKNNIKIKELSKTSSNKKGDGGAKLTARKGLRIYDLWRYKPPKLQAKADVRLSETAKEIIKLAADETDHIFSRNGETLRYLGLPFFRVRATPDDERAWFGIEKPRYVLNEDSIEDLGALIEDLKKYRRFDSPNKQHAYYQTAPEAWLEAILRRDITQLDTNLILSPIFNQFRTSRDKIDLLALRKDGRLVIIELKVSADREMIFQAVDYWRKIELQRRKGILNDARLFGDLDIADKPAIVYLAAPTSGFHRDFTFLAKTISRKVEIFRFDLAEDWREKLKVIGRNRIV